MSFRSYISFYTFNNLKLFYKKVVFLFLIGCFVHYTKAQSSIDSLKNSIPKLAEDSNKVISLNKLAWKLVFNAPDSAIKYSNIAAELAKKINFKKGLAQSYSDLGAVASIQAKNKEAINYYIESLRIREQIHDERGIGICYINIGQIHSSQGQFKESLAYYKKALKQFEKLKNEAEIAAIYNSIGILYNDKKLRDSAIYYIEKSLQIRTKINDEEGLSECYGNLGAIYHAIGDSKKALVYYQLDNQLNKKTGNDYGITIGLNNLSLVYADMGNLNEAIKIASQSAEISEKKGYMTNLQYALGNLAEFFYKKKDYLMAYKTLGQYTSVRDSIKNENLSRTINDLAIKYETDQKEKQNVILQKENELSAKTIKQQKTTAYFITTGLVLALLLAFFVFRGLKQQKKSNQIISGQKQEVENQKKLVEKQKEIIEEKQKEVMDSIHYANRIQKALLASDTLLKNHLPDYFVLFKPKAIVSGDFYWASVLKNSQFALITADSTGHGVPGAFMSLLNISFLNESINERNLINPADILNHTRNRLIQSLSEDGSNEGGKDGMDCTLCCFDFKNKTLSYSAANNSFYIIRNKELVEYDADKMPVGRSPKENEPFTMKKIDLQSGDVIFTLTDGLPDQFGGDKGKKFKYKQLEELLLQISDKPMPLQKEILHSKFENWKGNLEQVDDVLIIGIKI